MLGLSSAQKIYNVDMSSSESQIAGRRDNSVATFD